jgi:hypothetical protein
MPISATLCAVLGHKWRIDDTVTGSEPIVRCGRCGKHEIAPEGSEFTRCRDTETKAASWRIGPGG